MSETKAVIKSDSVRKNISQRVYHNVDADGRKFSITRHEVLNSAKPAYRRQFKKGNQ